MVDSSKFKEMSPMELDRWMTENKEFCLIDILPNDHFCKIHLPDSKNACVFEINFIDQIKDIIQDKDTQIVLYGSSDRSMDALKAAEKLEMEGYKNLIVLKGGLKDWQSHGFILEVVGAFLGRFFFLKRYGTMWRQYAPVLLAGFSCGMGLTGMFAMGLTLILKSLGRLAY